MGETLAGPVGVRFRKQNVANNSDDQGKIIDLLAKVSKSDGGKKEEWSSPPSPGPTHTCNAQLAQAIWDFHEHWKRKGHFQNIDGVVDPNMNTLAHLNLLAGGVVPPAPIPGGFFIMPLKQNANFTLDGTTATQREPPIHPVAWIQRTQGVFDQIAAHPLGRQLLASISRKVTVEPRLPNDKNAGVTPTAAREFLSFTAENFDDGMSNFPGGRADEMLFHELIHIADGHRATYRDDPAEELKYHESDFMTVTGTNVYSSSLNRLLRAQHDGFRSMPDRYALSPASHVATWRGNYEQVMKFHGGLFNMFRNQPAAWNPFKLLAP